MVKCSAPLCGNATYKKTPEITFHRFPKDKDMKHAWCIKMKKQDWQPASSSMICSKHFEAHLIDNSGFRTVLAPGAIPTIFDPLQGTTLTPTIVNKEHSLRDIQNIQPGVFSAVPNYDEDNHKKEEEIRKLKHKDFIKDKRIKALKQQNRRLQNKLLLFSAIISNLKRKLNRDKNHVSTKIIKKIKIL